MGSGLVDCDDGNACTKDTYVPGGCLHVAAEDATACALDACTAGTCKAGLCKAGAPLLWSANPQSLFPFTAGYVMGVVEAPNGTILTRGHASSTGWVTRYSATGAPLHNVVSNEIGGPLKAFAPLGDGVVVASGSGGTVRLNATMAKMWSALTNSHDIDVAPNGDVLTVYEADTVGLARLSDKGVKIWEKSPLGPFSGYVPNRLLARGDAVWILGNSLQNNSNPVGGPFLLTLSPEGTNLRLTLLGPKLGVDAQWYITSACGDPAGGAYLTLLWALSDVKRKHVRINSDGTVAWVRTTTGGNQVTRPACLADGSMAVAVSSSTGAPSPSLDRWSASGQALLHKSFSEKNTVSSPAPAGTGLVLAWYGAAGTELVRMDIWGNPTCTTSGACAGMASDACFDGDPCTSDLCGAGKCQ